MTQTDAHAEQASRPAVLPENAAWHGVGGVDGWVYTLFDPYGEQYVFFLWDDGSGYAVSIVDPPLERDPDAAELRVQPDGRLGPFANGYPVTLLAAFQMSVAWVAFRSISRRVGTVDCT